MALFFRGKLTLLTSASPPVPFTWVLLLILFWSSPALSPVFGQSPGDDPQITYTHQPVFRIPFQAEPGDNRLKEVQLYVSADQGQSWHPYASAPPDQTFFKFTADRDGCFWFAVRTVDMEGRAHPLVMEGVRPGLKVCVDTQAPLIELRPQPPRDGLIGVGWEVRDTNLDTASLRVDYRLAGTTEWSPIRADQVVSGQAYWKPYTVGQFEVRLRVRDRAENWGEKAVTVVSGAENRTTSEGPAPKGSALPAPGDPAVRMVNSKRISLNYEIKEQGPSGVSAVELWYTQDGRSWLKYPENINPKPPFILDVNDEGVYGFTLVVRSGVGLGGNPPQVGDPPQVWVEVDLTKPLVHVNAVDVGRGADSGKLTITWDATDKNLSRQPITLSYAKQVDGTWTPIAANQENTGRYIWKMPADVPYSFFIRVEATDRAGNVGVAQTPNPVIVDLMQPKGVILDVSPGK